MNGKQAKRCRKIVYGEDGSPRLRKYRRGYVDGPITAGEDRRGYQRIKRSVKNKEVRLLGGPWFERLK